MARPTSTLPKAATTAFLITFAAMVGVVFAVGVGRPVAAAGFGVVTAAAFAALVFVATIP